MPFKCRAITDEQKKERRKEILNTAQYLFEKTPYKSLSMEQIAKKANIAKGTIFIYFKTKEELFFALTLQEYKKCFQQINLSLNNYLSSGTTCSIDKFIEILCPAFIDNKILLKLIAITSVILEYNIDYKTAFEFKIEIANQIQTTSKKIEKVIPFLKEGDGNILLLHLHILATGIQHISEPSPVIKEVVLNEQCNMFCINFNDFFISTIKTILLGIKSKNSIT